MLFRAIFLIPLVFAPAGLFSQESSETVKTDEMTLSSAPAEKIPPDPEITALLDSIKTDLNGNPALGDIKKKNLVLYKLNSSRGEIHHILAGNYEIKESTFGFREALSAVRKAIAAYFIKTNRRPKNLDELVPYYLPYLPKTKVSDIFDNRTKYVRNSAFDKNYRAAVDGKTEYLYFSDPQSIHYGLILLNSIEKSPEGSAYFEY